MGQSPKVKTNSLRDFGISFGTGLTVLGLGIGARSEDPELMRQLISQAPGVFAALLITIFFLRYLRDIRHDEQETMAQIMATAQETHDRCHKVHDLSIQAINRNTMALGELRGQRRSRNKPVASGSVKAVSSPTETEDGTV